MQRLLVLADFGFEGVHVILGGVGVRLGGTLDVVEQFRAILLKLFVVESNVARSSRVDVCCQYWVRPKLSESVEVELPSKA